MLNSNTISHLGFRSFVPLCSASTSSGPSHSHWRRMDGASTLPRTKSKAYSSPAWSAKPSISIPLAQKLDCSSPLAPRRPKLSDSLHLPASGPTDPPPPPDPPPPCVSSTLPVPTLRLSPSPTSLCQGGSGTRQPSSVARERRARSISILTTNIQPVSSKERSVNQEQRDVFDVPHSALRGHCSVASHRQAAETQNSFELSGKVDLIKEEHGNADKSTPPPRKLGTLAIRQLNFNSKKQLGFLPNAATGTQTLEPEGIPPADVGRKSGLAFDARPTHSGVNLHRKHRTAQTAGCGSKEPLREHLAIGGNADLPAAPLGSDSTAVFWNESTVVPKLRQLSCNTDAALPSGPTLSRPSDENMRVTTSGLSAGAYQQTSAAPNKMAPQKYSLREDTNTRMNVGSTLNRCSDALKDYCSRSKGEACQESRFSESKLFPQCSDQQQTGLPASCGPSQTKCSKSDITPCKQKLQPGQNKSQQAANPSNTGLNQTAEGPAELPECSAQSWVEDWPLSVEQRSRPPNGPGNKSNGVFDFLAQAQQRVYQRAADATPMASPSLTQANYRRPDRVVFLEEDPHYVTMYHPGSVYVGE